MNNAAMALAVSRLVIGRAHDEDNLTQEEIKGLKYTRWPGRSQICTHENRTVYLDGAHTTGKWVIEWHHDNHNYYFGVIIVFS